MAELDMSKLQISDDKVTQEENATTAEEQASANPAATSVSSPVRRAPYVNLDRAATGGSQRDKLTDEELKERMARIRDQNDKIKARRLVRVFTIKDVSLLILKTQDVQADEEAFAKTQAAERLKQAKQAKVQETVNRTREENAKRKMSKIQSREWDSEKSKEPGKSKRPDRPANASNLSPAPVEAVNPSASSSADTAATETASSNINDPADNSSTTRSPSSNVPQRGRGGRGRGRGGHAS